MTIRVRRASPNDAAAYAAIMGDPAVYPGLLQMPHTDAETWRVRLTEICAAGKHDLPLVAELNGEVIGSAGLHPVGAGMRRRHVMALGIAVAAQAQGQGVGSALMQAMCDYADRWAGALRLELSVTPITPSPCGFIGSSASSSKARCGAIRCATAAMPTRMRWRASTPTHRPSRRSGPTTRQPE